LLGIAVRHNDLSVETEVWGLPGFGPALIDAGAICIRFLIHETFGFLPSRELLEDVLIDIAHRNRFHPVCDYLDKLKWDGIPRIGNWLAIYAGAEDTPLNRAIGQCVLIAAVRRVRKPGVKFEWLLSLAPGLKSRSNSRSGPQRRARNA
jgi:predicted P-loop ATPase